MESLRRRSMRPSFFPSSVPSSPPPSPISFDVSPPNNTLSLLGNTCWCSMSRDRLLNYYGPDNPIVHHRIGYAFNTLLLDRYAIPVIQLSACQAIIFVPSSSFCIHRCTPVVVGLHSARNCLHRILLCVLSRLLF